MQSDDNLMMEKLSIELNLEWSVECLPWQERVEKQAKAAFWGRQWELVMREECPWLFDL